jgi:hypothetical protein
MVREAVYQLIQKGNGDRIQTGRAFEFFNIVTYGQKYYEKRQAT